MSPWWHVKLHIFTWLYHISPSQHVPVPLTGWVLLPSHPTCTRVKYVEHLHFFVWGGAKVEGQARYSWKMFQLHKKWRNMAIHCRNMALSIKSDFACFCLVMILPTWLWFWLYTCHSPLVRWQCRGGSERWLCLESSLGTPPMRCYPNLTVPLKQRRSSSLFNK